MSNATMDPISNAPADHDIVSPEDWLKARLDLLTKEKEFLRMRDQLSRDRRALPWERVEKDYTFEGPQGQVSLAELFDKHDQLIIYHFMYGPDWETGCPSCSFWADGFDGIDIHLAQRNIAFMAISRAPLQTINAFKQRMGWKFRWFSSFSSNFNQDYKVSFSKQDREDDTVYYNYRSTPFPADEAPGVSVFIKGADGTVFHTYSCYSRGLDSLNSAYQYMDLAPMGRDEKHLAWPMEWVRRHDEYEVA